MDWHKVYIKKDIVHPIARFVNLITPEHAAGLLIWFYDWRVLIKTGWHLIWILHILPILPNSPIIKLCIEWAMALQAQFDHIRLFSLLSHANP